MSSYYPYSGWSFTVRARDARGCPGQRAFFIPCQLPTPPPPPHECLTPKGYLQFYLRTPAIFPQAFALASSSAFSVLPTNKVTLEYWVRHNWLSTRTNTFDKDSIHGSLEPGFPYVIEAEMEWWNQKTGSPAGYLLYYSFYIQGVGGADADFFSGWVVGDASLFGQWHHVAYTYEVGGKFRLFIDGVKKVESVPAMAIDLDHRDDKIQWSALCYDDHTVDMDSMRLSDDVLYSSNFTPTARDDVAVEVPTQLLFKCDEPSGLDMIDETSLHSGLMQANSLSQYPRRIHEQGINLSALPTGAMADTPFSATVVASNGDGPYTYAVKSGALPEGLTLSLGGVLSGTPAGSLVTNQVLSRFSIEATDSFGCKGSQDYDFWVVGTLPSQVNLYFSYLASLQENCPWVQFGTPPDVEVISVITLTWNAVNSSYEADFDYGTVHLYFHLFQNPIDWTLLVRSAVDQAWPFYTVSIGEANLFGFFNDNQCITDGGHSARTSGIEVQPLPV